MEDMDLKLKLFGGESLMAEGYGDIKPLTVRQVISYGYTNYMKSLNIICLDKDDFIKNDEEYKELEELNIIDLLIAFGGDEIESELEKALSLFLGGEAIIDKDHLCVFIKIDEDNIKMVNGGNYDNIKEVIKWQNYVNHFTEKKVEASAPMDEETRKFKERLEELQKKRDEIKRRQNQGDDDESQSLDFYDIVSSISSKSFSINELNVMDLTVCQVYIKFKRLEAIDQYDINIKSILAGAKDIKLKHWSTKID